MLITCVGDFILSRRMHKFYEEGSVEKIFHDTLPLFRNSDLNLCNLETIITNVGFPFAKKEKNPYYFRCSTKLAKLLIDAHIHAVTTANNHSMDFGEKGLLYQKKFLNQIGIANAGSGENISKAKEPMYIDVNGLVVCVISFCTVRPKTIYATEEKGGVFFIHQIEDISKELKDIIEEARNKSDILIASPHWVENWAEEPQDNLRQEARKLIDLGCDAILGHSSHLLLGMEIYKNCPIVYDMGTFLVDTIAGNKQLKHSAIFQLEISEATIRALRVYPTRLRNGGVSLDTAETFQYVRGKLSSLNDNGFDSLNQTVNDDCIQFTFPKVKKDPLVPSAKPSRVFSPKTIDKKSNLFDLRPNCIYYKTEYKDVDFKTIEFEDGYKILDYKTVESFRVGSGFLSVLIFQVGSKNLEDIEVHIRGVSNYGKEFNVIHPVSNGVHNSLFWKTSEIIKDETCARVNRNIEPGIYTLYAGFINPETKKYIQTIQKHNLAQVGTIYALPELISNLASGIDWSGKLDSSVKNKFEEEFVNRPEKYLFQNIRDFFCENRDFEKNFSLRAFQNKYSFDPSLSLVYLTLFDKSNGSIRWGSRRKTLKLALSRNIEKIKEKTAYKKYQAQDSTQCGVLLEMITERNKVKIGDLLENDQLYQKNGFGFEFIYEDIIDVLVTESECNFFSLKTNRQKIAFALIKHKLVDFHLENFLRDNTDRIEFNTIKTVSLVDYKGQIDNYSKFSSIGEIIYA